MLIAMKAAEDGIALADASGERCSAELHRLHGELLARPPHGQKGKAEAEFRTAIEVAKQQGAATFERNAKAKVYEMSCKRGPTSGGAFVPSST